MLWKTSAIIISRNDFLPWHVKFFKTMTFHGGSGGFTPRWLSRVIWTWSDENLVKAYSKLETQFLILKVFRLLYLFSNAEGSSGKKYMLLTSFNRYNPLRIIAFVKKFVHTDERKWRCSGWTNNIEEVTKRTNDGRNWLSII